MLMAGIKSGEFDSATHHFQFYQQGNTFQQNNEHKHVPRNWILLDNRSTVDVFCNSALQEDIHEAATYMTIHCNAGRTSTNLKGTLPGYGYVWFHPEGIANVLSLSRVRDAGYCITYDSTGTNEFIIHKPNGDCRVFKESPTRLFYSDTTDTGILLINTVAENREHYTDRDYQRAKLARQIQQTIGRPNTKHFIQIIENNLLPKVPITKADIIAAENIFGPDLGSLKAKTVRQKGIHVNPTLEHVPPTIMELYQNITPAGDIMFIN
jgi:hypothetical protein